jgi:PKD repeat protein
MKRTIIGLKVGFLVAAVAAVAGCALFNQPPVGNFLWSPLEPLARADISFNDQSSDSGGLFGGGGIVSWNWDFGDGDSSTAPNPKHAYDKSGSYTVRLTVTDDAGDATTITKTVLVTPSLNGTWSGYLEDPTGFLMDMTLRFTHSSTSIQGSCNTLGAQLSCSGISFDPVAKTVRFELFDLGIRLEGTLDAAERRIQGRWFVIGAPFAGWDWDVRLP